jgi:hypothetical protein
VTTLSWKEVELVFFGRGSLISATSSAVIANHLSHTTSVRAVLCHPPSTQVSVQPESGNTAVVQRANDGSDADLLGINVETFFPKRRLIWPPGYATI